jgi:hypothetical protein
MEELEKKPLKCNGLLKSLDSQTLKSSSFRRAQQKINQEAVPTIRHTSSQLIPPTIASIEIMLVTGIQRISSNCKMARTLATSVIRGHNNRNSNAPLLEKYRPVWPDSDFGKGNVEELPLRSVPQEDLKFQLTASFENGSSLFYPHLPHNPADFKVKLSVRHFYDHMVNDGLALCC